MKQSVYRAARVAEHRRRLTELSPDPKVVEHWAILKTENDVEAAEAAGVVWDPEDEPLPDKLVYGPIAEGLNFRPALAPVEPRRGWSSREQELRGYAEAVRRYNAWPELEKLAGPHDPGEPNWRTRLRAILRGGAS